MKTYIKPEITTICIDGDSILENSLLLGDPDTTVTGGLSKERDNVCFGENDETISW